MNNIQRYTVNNQSVWRGRLTKIKGVCQDLMPNFVIRPLNRSDAEEMGNLSATIYSNLGKGEESFIHRHDKEYYHEVFDNEDIHYIGVFTGSKLIGMSYIRLCRDKESFDAEIPHSPIDFFEGGRTTLVAAMGADCVHPEYRGNQLNQTMIQCRLELASDLGCSDAFSIIDRNNHWNMSPYFNNGFNMYASATDPSDNGKIALMHNDFQNNSQSNSSAISVPYNRLNLIDSLLAKGYVGNGYDPENGNIKFVLNRQNERNRLRNNFSILPQTSKGVYCVC